MINDTHRDIQERLLDRLILILGGITIPAVSISLFRFFSIGWKPAFTVHLAVAAFFLLVAVYRKSISYHVKVGVVVAVFFLLAISSALNLGMMGFLVGFLMLALFLGIVFWGRKPAMGIYLAGASVILTIGVLTVRGIVSPNTRIENYTTFYTSWITTLVGFTFITGLSILIVGEIGHILADKIAELRAVNQALEKANNEINTLTGLLPVCAHCKNIRDDSGYWRQIEDYISTHSDVTFTHGICQKCADKLYPELNLNDDTL